MGFLPDWVPSLHPYIVHFPIALLVSAALVDLVAVFARERPGVLRAANLLYLFGALAAIGTYFSGRQAADLVFLEAEAQGALTEHADLGLWTMWFFIGYVIVRLPLSVSAIGRSLGVRAILFVVGAGGVGLVGVTAHHGAELVYRHGAGVQVVEDMPVQKPVARVDSASAAGGGLLRSEDGGWTWAPTRAAAWQAEVDWIEGKPGEVASSLVDGGQRGDVIAMDLERETVFFTFPGSIDGVQMDFEADLSDLDGTLMIAFEVVDADNYRFASFGDATARLGRAENGDLLVGESADIPTVGWSAFRVVVDNGHARTYVDTEMAVHGHFEPSGPGRVGLRINGTGRVRLAFLTATPVRESQD